MEEGALVALKIFVPQARLDEKSLELLHQDLEKVDSLRHPGLLQPYSIDIQDGKPYFVLPYLHKGSLHQKLQEEGPLSESEVALLLQQVGRALFYLHAHELPTLHRNLNPDNILITDDGNYVLSDYGISNRTRSALRKVVGHTTTMPPEYAPPELFSAQPRRTAASDIFSFGVILYEACSGEIPWMGSGGIALLQGAAIPQLPFRYARELQNIVKACLDPDFEKRPSATELEQEGTYFLEHGNWKTFGRFAPATVKVVEYNKSSSLKPVFIGLAALLALFAAAAAYFLYIAPDAWQKLTSSEATATVIRSGSPAAADERAAAAATPAETALPETAGDTQQPPQASPAPAAAPGGTPAPAPPAPAPRATAPARTNPRPAYRKPASLTGFLQQLPNEKVPIAVRERWRTDIQRYFAPDAIVSYTADGALIGVFTVNEMVDMLLSADTSSTIQVTNMHKNEEGKIEELNVASASGR